MQRINPEAELSALQQRTQSTTNGSQSEEAACLADQSIVTLFKTFGRRWSHKWEKTNADPKARAVWLHDLRQLGVNDNNIRAGLSKSAALEWPPSPAEFAALCLAVPGLPSADDAWAEALPIARRWKRPHECSHPAVYHALSQVVNYNMIDEETLHKRFVRNYERVCADLAAGKDLAPIAQPLPRPEDVQTNYDPAEVSAARDRALAEIDRMLGRRQ